MREEEQKQSITPEVFKSLITSVITEYKLKTSEEIPWVIKVFGSAVVVILFSVIAGAFQQCFSGIHDLNAVVRSNNEKFIKYEEFTSRLNSQWGTIREIQSNQSKMSGLEERIKTTEIAIKKLETDLTSSKDEISKLRERITVLEKK
jgi:septal ring factor EnvC (AmiA/AmiB activator)